MSGRWAGVVAVIPSRYDAVRFPGKPLVPIQGRPMVRWVYEAARKALPTVIVATDDKRIFDAVRGFGGEAMMTPSSCASGTDRMAAVARRVPGKIFVNVQGDEPLMDARVIREVAALSRRTRSIATAAIPLPDETEAANPNVVKVVFDKDGRALYFSRSRIPFPREGKPALVWKHLGIYAYPVAALRRFVRLKPAPIEQIEKLEQLRALHNGMPIYVAKTQWDSVGVDTPEDLREVERRLSSSRHVVSRDH